MNEVFGKNDGLSQYSQAYYDAKDFRMRTEALSSVADYLAFYLMLREKNEVPPFTKDNVLKYADEVFSRYSEWAKEQINKEVLQVAVEFLDTIGLIKWERGE